MTMHEVAERGVPLAAPEFAERCGGGGRLHDRRCLYPECSPKKRQQMEAAKMKQQYYTNHARPPDDERVGCSIPRDAKQNQSCANKSLHCRHRPFAQSRRCARSACAKSQRVHSGPPQRVGDESAWCDVAT